MLLRNRSRYHDLLMSVMGKEVAALMERDKLEEAVAIKGETQAKEAAALGLPLALEGAIVGEEGPGLTPVVERRR